MFTGKWYYSLRSNAKIERSSDWIRGCGCLLFGVNQDLHIELIVMFAELLSRMQEQCD